MQAVRESGLLDSPPEPAFDDLARLAALVLGMPIALISIVDERRQYLKSHIGLDATETSRDVSFCAHAILKPDACMVVEDAGLDERFCDNPLVLGDPGIRFYAGTPLLDRHGHALGALCVIDREPRALTTEQVKALKTIGRQVADQIELRRVNRRLREAVDRFNDAERELRARELQFDRLVAAVPDHVILMLDPKGCIMNWSPAMERVYGYEPFEVIGRHVSVLHPPENEDAADASLRVAAEFGVYRNTGRRTRRDGSTFWAEVSVASIRDSAGVLLGYAKVASDVTAQLEQTREIKAQRDRFEAVMEASANAICECSAEGQIVLANRAARSIMGLDRVEGIAYNAPELRHERLDGSALPDEEMPFVIVKKTGRPVRDYIHVIRKPDGTRVILSINGDPIFAADGSFQSAVFSFSDITASFILNQQLERAKDAAESANRAKSRFLANMSHEIRTPLGAMLGFTDLIAESAEDPELVRQHAAIVRKNGDHLLSLINDIIDISKIESGKVEVEMSEVDPLAIARDIVELFQSPAASKRIELTLRAEGELPRFISSDVTRLRQILNNLVSNAVKFTPDGGAIELRVAGSQSDPRMLLIECKDTGIGIDAAGQSRLFEAFSQVDDSTVRKHGGAGLGLNISRRLARLLGGDLTVKSQPGEGSTFTLALPISMAGADRSLPHASVASKTPANARVATEASNPSAARDAVGAGQTKKTTQAHPGLVGRTAMIVDDTEDNRVLLQAILRRQGMLTTEARDGREALDRLIGAIADGSQPDIVLLDMQMPELDGYDTARELRSRGFKHPIIAITAHAMAEDRRRCFDAGCTEYAPKPVQARQLLSLIEKLVASASCDRQAA
jgi:PAS domain S-box-containing protein